MKSRNVRKLALIAAILTIALVVIGLFPLNLASKAAIGRSEKRFSGRQVAPNLDVRDRFSKVSQTSSLGDIKKQEKQGSKGKARAGASESMLKAKDRLAREVPNLQVVFSEETGAPELVSTGVGRKMLTAKSAQSKEAAVRGFLAKNHELYGLSLRQIGQLKKVADYTNPAGNLAWVELQQEIGGRPVFQGVLRAALTPQGELFRTVGKLVPELDYAKVVSEIKLKGTAKQRGESAAHASAAKDLATSAAQAIAIGASSIGLSVDPESLVVREASDDGSTIVFEPGPFADVTKAELVYFPLGPGDVTAAWSFVIWQDVPSYYILVDAQGAAEVLWRKNITDDQTQPATYSFYNDDSPAPLSPSNSIPGASVQGAAIPRTLISLISELPAFDNLGWMTDGVNTTTGNNVDAGMDLVAPNGIDPGSRPVGAPFRVFDFPYNPAPGIPPPGDAPTLANYRFGEAVNMFVWSNRYHDRLYELGFTEAARNFQTNNFGRGGLGNDHVLAEGQDFSGTNNANFNTPPDGTSGRMQMYIFTGPTPDRTSGLDQEILIHELTHGTSNRLHANAAGLAATMSGGMGEGWSDFYARALLSQASEDVNGVYAAGGYSTLQIVAGFTDNYYYGIRRFPYAVKSTVGPNGKPHNPLTFADIDPTQINLTDGAFPRGPIGSGAAFQVHNIGEVWCMTLLEMRARLITRLGFATGNQKALQLVTDGMKLEPATPTLVEGRNAILAANCASGGTSADELDIWQGFATRGLGADASAVSASSSSVVEDFDMPTLNVGTVIITADSCDNAGVADPGETVTLNIPLTNPFCVTAVNNVSLQVTGGGSANYGDIAPGASVSRAISFTVPEETPCGSILPVELTIDSSLGQVVKTFNLQIGQPTGILPAVTYSSGNIAVPIPDVNTVDIPINVPDSGAVGDVNVSVRLNHTFDGDLAISLIAPDGTSVALANNRGGAGDNYGSGANDCSGTPTVFDDSAANPISSGVAPFAGTFRPDSPLSAMNGRSMNGVWKVRVSDTASLDVGTVGCVQLAIREQLYFCCGVDGDPIIEAAPPATLVAECGTNGAPDPGEVVTMSFPLRNIGTGVTTDLVATLQPSGGITPISGPQSYGSISPVGPAVSRNFTFAVPNVACGSDIIATFALQDGATNLGTVTFTIRVGATVTTVTPGTNNAPITIPATGTGAATGAPATPYPSNINIAGVTGTVTKVKVKINNFSHTFPSDVDMLLVGPAGQKFIIVSDVIGGTDAVNVNWTLDDSAATGLPSAGTPVSGTFRPTNIGTGDLFPAPAPPAPYQSPATAGSATFASLFNGTNPNGTWSLYVVDDAGIDVGSIAGGWELEITTADPVCETIQPVSISNVSVDKPSLYPPNHKMKDVTVNYDVQGCSSCTLSVQSNEPIEGTGDGDSSPDWEIVDGHHVKLRAERAGTGSGRIYTITITCLNGINSDSETVEVHVAHNITGPPSGSSFRINSPVNLAGTFWDIAGRTHTARWLFDGALSAIGSVTEPSGSRLGTARGTYSFANAGVYKVSLNLTDNLGTVSSVNSIGDLEALVVIYDPNGAYTIGGGTVFAPAGSYRNDPAVSGKVAFGFQAKYTKAANPKGETQINFTNGNFEFNALNYDYLAVSGARAQFRGFGKVNGDAGYSFILTVIDGQATNGGGVDLFRIKIWNKVSGAVVLDTQMGASEAADPTTPVAGGGSIVIQK